MTAGTVLSLHRFPVKSLAGERVDALQVDRRGAGGDRAHAVFGERAGRSVRLTARQAPRMLAWSAAYPDAPGDALDPAAPPLPVLAAPDGRRFAWDDGRLPAALGDDLGRPVHLRRDLDLMLDLPDSLLLTVEASRRAAESALGRSLDLRRFRPNVHVALDAPAFAEERWAGRRLRIGDTRFELLHPCERCVIPTRDPATTRKWPELLRWLARERQTLFGINVRAVAPGTIRVGDSVEVT